MMKYKVGDKVRVVEKPNIKTNGTYDMDAYAGQIVTISAYFNDTGIYKIKEDKGEWYWDDELLEPIDKTDVCENCMNRDNPSACNICHTSLGSNIRTGEITRKNIQVNICGIMHEVKEKKDVFDGGHFGMIDYKKCEILIADDLSEDAKAETICHEMIHGILMHLGYDEQSRDEQFVQALSNAIYNSFWIKGV